MGNEQDETKTTTTTESTPGRVVETSRVEQPPKTETTKVERNDQTTTTVERKPE